MSQYTEYIFFAFVQGMFAIIFGITHEMMPPDAKVFSLTLSIVVLFKETKASKGKK